MLIDTKTENRPGAEDGRWSLQEDRADATAPQHFRTVDAPFSQPFFGGYKPKCSSLLTMLRFLSRFLAEMLGRLFMVNMSRSGR